MTLNPDIIPILRQFKIDVSQGTLCLLGYYFGLDVDSTCSEEVVKAINLTKIVVKDYTNNSIQWNMPLFQGQETAFAWVADWLEAFGRANPERKGSPRDAASRMKMFFQMYPEYRKEDVYKARDLYIAGTASMYVMKSHKFIFDGAGAMKKSTLLEYCERVKLSPNNNQLKGKIIS